MCTRGQYCHEHWYLCRKAVTTVSKAHEVISKKKKLRNGGGGAVKIGSLKVKISGITFVNPNIPDLKHERDRESEAVIYLQHTSKTTTRTKLFQNVRWFLMKPWHTLGQAQTD